MTAASIRKQVDDYLPLLTAKQQVLILEMMKSMLNLDTGAEHMTLKQYNDELNDAAARVNEGNFVTHAEALKKLKRKWWIYALSDYLGLAHGLGVRDLKLQITDYGLRITDCLMQVP